MKPEMIIKAMAILTVAFAVMILSGYLRGASNDAWGLSTAEAQAFVGVGNCLCAAHDGECTDCVNSGSGSVKYNMGPSLYACVNGDPDQECYSTDLECGTSESGGGFSVWDNRSNCQGEPDSFRSVGLTINGVAIGSPC
jgi:hypothetical protein